MNSGMQCVTLEVLVINLEVYIVLFWFVVHNILIGKLLIKVILTIILQPSKLLPQCPHPLHAIKLFFFAR